MRILAILLFLLAALIGGTAILFYLWAGGMSCGFVSSTSCGIKWPWQLSAEDLIVAVLLPGFFVALLVWAGRGAWRASRIKA